MPKPYPNNFSSYTPAFQTLSKRQVGRPAYPTKNENSTSTYKLAYNAESIVGSRNSVSSLGFPKRLGMNMYSYGHRRLTSYQGSVVRTLKNANATTISSVYTYTGTWSAGVFSGGVAFLPASAAIRTNLYNQVINTMLGRVKDQKANWSENAAQYRQAIDMITSKVTMISKAVNALRKGDLLRAATALGITPPIGGNGAFQKRYARNRSKAVARQWLEFQYGWRPLVQDIYETTKHIHALYSKKPPLERSSATAKDISTDETFSSLGWDAGGVTVVRTTTLKCKAVCYYSSSSGNLLNLKQLGLLNPAALAWELLPFSFVLDWLLPVGNFFNNLDATVGVNFIKGCVTTSTESSIVGSQAGTKIEPAFDGYSWAYSLSSFAQDLAISRVPLSDFPFPAPPHLKNPVSTEHLLNALALLTVNIKGR